MPSVSSFRCAVLGVLISSLLFSCSPVVQKAGEKIEIEPAELWSGDYPVAALDLLPFEQQQNRVGYLGNERVFNDVWSKLKPGEPTPAIDFRLNLVVYSRNVDFYNRTQIFKVIVSDGKAEILAMETMTALPVEDKVAMALAVVPRKGIRLIRSGEKSVVVTDPR